MSGVYSVRLSCTMSVQCEAELHYEGAHLAMEYNCEARKLAIHTRKRCNITHLRKQPHTNNTHTHSMHNL